MASSYLGIVSQSGLKTLEPEGDHLGRFLLRRVYGRGKASAICCSAVLDDAHADLIRTVIQAGDWDNALILLNLLAVDLGTLLPESADQTQPRSTCA